MSYQIIDEPKPTTLSKLTVNPLWPLLSAMLGGFVFSWIWFALNTLALNGPGKMKQLLTLAGAFAAFVVIYHGGIALAQTGFFGTMNRDYFFLFGIAVQLTFCYMLFLQQSGEFEVYQYFGGKVATPVIGLVLGLAVGKELQIIMLELVWGA